MRYEGKHYRPPSEADSLIVQTTIGCSWNHCTYCDMYRDKTFRVRPLAEVLEDLESAGAAFGEDVEKLFVADGDALVLPMDHWLTILTRARQLFPRLRTNRGRHATGRGRRGEESCRAVWSLGH